MKIISRLLILVVLFLGVGFVLFSSNTQSVSAKRCCETCPGGGDPPAAADYCMNQCDPTDQSCIEYCVLQLNNCYSYCMFCADPDPGPKENRGFFCLSEYVQHLGYYTVFCTID